MLAPHYPVPIVITVPTAFTKRIIRTQTGYAQATGESQDSNVKFYIHQRFIGINFF